MSTKEEIKEETGIKQETGIKEEPELKKEGFEYEDGGDDEVCQAFLDL